MGDVAGHGIGSAMVMMSARSLLRALAASRDDLSEVMKSMNDLMTADLPEGMFMSLFYAELDPSSRSLRYLSAGHEPPILYRASTGQVEHLDSTTFAMGFAEGADPGTPVQVALAPGDILVVYTDGIHEAWGQDEMYGRQRLVHAIVSHADLAPAGLVESLLSDVRDFCGDCPQRDDMTVLVVKAG